MRDFEKEYDARDKAWRQKVARITLIALIFSLDVATIIAAISL